MIGEIVINGKSSKDFNVYLSDAGVYGTPERDTTTVQIEGRSGDLIIDNNRYKNKLLRFPCIITQDFEENFEAFVGFLLGLKGYATIETSFKPDEYVLGRYIGEVDPVLTDDSHYGKFEIVFDRKPQRFIKDGDMPLTFTAAGSIYNPYNGEAKPIVRVYGTGAVTIGSVTITVNSVDTYVDIDCDLQDAHKGSTNCNGNITLNSNEFFTLIPGVNGITLGNGISKVVITPKWWKL